MSKSVAPYIKQDQEFLHALTLYGRLSGAERSVLDVVLLKTAGWNRHSHQIGLVDFEAYCPSLSRSGIQLALRRLTAKPDTKIRCQAGHNILVRESKHTPTEKTAWAVNSTWRTWGWTDREALTHAASILAEYKRVLLPETWSQDAVELATTLRDYIVAMAGPEASLPTVSTDDRTWRRWCATMESLLVRQHHRMVIQNVLVWAMENDHWGPRLCRMSADRTLADNFDELKTRTLNARRHTYI